jgi:hypothetical protein
MPPMTATSDYTRPTSDKYASVVDSNAFVAKTAEAGPVGVKAMDGKTYVDPTGGINYDLGIIDRSVKMGDKRSGKIVINDANDGITQFSSGLVRNNTTEQHLLYLEAQSKHSVKKEYTWDVELAAADGASVDPEIEAERQRLAKESEARKAANKAKLKRQNTERKLKMEKDAVHGKYATIVDDDIMDEAAGRERLRLASESLKRRTESIAAQKEQALYERSRIANTKSKIYSWNDQFKAQIDQRQQEEAHLNACTRARAGGGGGTHPRTHHTRTDMHTCTHTCTHAHAHRYCRASLTRSGILDASHQFLLLPTRWGCSQ